MQTQYEVPHYSPAHDMSASQYGQNLYVPNNNNNRIKSENGSERGHSPHPSDPSHSRYPSQAPTALHPGYPQPMNTMQPNMRYPSPGHMHQPMPMIQHSYHPNAPQDQSYVQQPMTAAPPSHEQHQQDVGRASAAGLPKAFACSTCSKGFARRSDLARHGAYSYKSLHHTLYMLIQIRAHPQRSPSPPMRIPRLREAIHPALGLDRAFTCPHGRETSHVRTLRKGQYKELSSNLLRIIADHACCTLALQ